MTRHIFTFLGTFLLGALIALAARTATHQPHADHAAATPAQSATPTATANPSPAVDHSQHGAAATPAKPTAQPATAGKPVNTICAICGMPVDPKLPTMEYQGQTIGFGCKMCPPKFKAEPDKYGPSYLRNEIIKR